MHSTPVAWFDRIGAAVSPSSLYVVQTNPVPGLESEFADWYDNHHMNEILRLPGFIAAKRYERSATQREQRALDYQYRSLALYALQGDPRPALEALTAALANGMQLSPAMANDRVSVLYNKVSERYVQ